MPFKFLQIVLLTYILFISNVNCFIQKSLIVRNPLINNKSRIQQQMNDNNGDNDNNDGNMMRQEPYAIEPSRYDTCRIFVSGIIGIEPREAYLSNGHYVINFALATVGHFNAQHEWERNKPSETMWQSIEMWDTKAKQAMNEGLIHKGARFAGVGHMIHNKWVDKQTGEDRKQFKVRILSLMSNDELDDVEIAIGISDDYRNPRIDEEEAIDNEIDMFGNSRNGNSAFRDASGSNFSIDAPQLEDQTRSQAINSQDSNDNDNNDNNNSSDDISPNADVWTTNTNRSRDYKDKSNDSSSDEDLIPF